MDIQSGYSVFIVTNKNKDTLEIGVAGDLSVKLYQLEYELQRGGMQTDTKAGCIYLVYWETLESITKALVREKQIKKLSQKMCEELINSKNPGWEFFNDDIYHAARSFLL